MCISVPITIKNEFFLLMRDSNLNQMRFPPIPLFKFRPKLHICVSRPKP